MCCAPTRLSLLRDECAQRGIAAMYVRDTSNIRWLTGFDDVFDEERAHALIVEAREGGRAVLHTDSRYSLACERAAAGTPVEVSVERASHAQVAAQLLGAAGAGSADHIADAQEASAAQMPTLPLGIEDTIDLAEYRKLEQAFGVKPGQVAPFEETDGLVVGLRAVKDADEVARMRQAQAITDAAFAHIVEFMAPGMTERAVQLELEDYMLRHGAQGLAFPSIVACGPNGASPHAIPGEARLEAGQCVVMDFGARARGYCSDMTRTVFVGQPDEALRAAWETLRRANEEVEAMLRPGVTGRQAHDLAEHILAEGGFGGKMGHGLGHGVGIDIHEEPVLAPRNERPLVAGNVVTVEPGIYVPGAFGMRLEDFGVVTDDGFAVFTASTHEMVVV